MFDKIFNFLGIERKIKKIDCDEIFSDFYESDISGSEIILDELRELFKKVGKTGIMHEFNGNSYSIEIYPDLVIIINSYNNNISKCPLDEFVKKMREKKL